MEEWCSFLFTAFVLLPPLGFPHVMAASNRAHIDCGYAGSYFLKLTLLGLGNGFALPHLFLFFYFNPHSLPLSTPFSILSPFLLLIPI